MTSLPPVFLLCVQKPANNCTTIFQNNQLIVYFRKQLIIFLSVESNHYFFFAFCNPLNSSRWLNWGVSKPNFSTRALHTSDNQQNLIRGWATSVIQCSAMESYQDYLEEASGRIRLQRASMKSRNSFGHNSIGFHVNAWIIGSREDKNFHFHLWSSNLRLIEKTQKIPEIEVKWCFCQ